MRRNGLKMRRPVLMALALVVLLASLSFGADIDRQTLELKLGGSDLVNTDFPVKRVSIANNAIADVVVLSPQELYVFGKQVGYTSVILWEGKNKTLLDVVVALDLTGLKEQIHRLYPDQKIEVYASETGVVLSGTVSGPEIVEQVIRLTKTFLPKQAEDGKAAEGGTGRSGTGITNLLKVGGIQQVMLEVKIAEVKRESTKDWQAALAIGKLGSDFAGAAASSALRTIPDTGSLLLNFADNAANVFLKVDNVTTALTFLEGEGLARVLAEPHLVAQSGQEASFLAGGEFPIPVPQNFDNITIEYKEFGVSLVFTPVVMSDGRISLRVAPSVSDIAFTQSLGSSFLGGEGFEVPTLSTRKLETTIQLQDGQTLALAGLLQDKLRETVRKVPGLGDIPILGPLFRSSEFFNEKTDLLIAVTPHLVKPVPENSIRFPGEDIQMPNGYEFYLEGRLEGRREAGDVSAISRHGFSMATEQTEDSTGLEGEFGYQPIAVSQ